MSLSLLDRWERTQKGSWIKEEKTSTEYKLEVIDKVVYVSFKGSTSFKDWVYNIFCVPFPRKPYKNMPNIWFAHIGFLKKWKAVQKDFMKSFEKIMVDNTIEQIYVMGHSQGGAVAHLCYEDIWFNYPDLRLKLKGEVFGAPTTFWAYGNKSLFLRFKSMVRYEYFWDVVPYLLPSIIGFFHVGKKCRVGKPWYKMSLKIIDNHVHYEKHIKEKVN